ncbi:unnamed protein product [Parnassius apollo]|uniref:(apollo) hypothetical protein n=1 Tax=Parnassius apollo TaxID=110799 RepID=A0A8S3X0I1_PARAO|nr:unnamed protein product [Parnassius apollo]
MPEKPKRRKNNKNKRKNKNVHVDPSINNITPNKNTSIKTNEKEVTEEVKGSFDPNIELSNPGISLIPNKSNDICISNKYDKMILNESNSKNYLEEPCNFVEKCDSPSLCVENTSSDNQETSCTLETYTVESPDQSNKSQSKLSNSKKSRSVDDDESPRIVEIIEDNNMPLQNSIIALDTCSDIEWEKTLDLEENNLPKIEEPITGTLSITTIPLTVAHCEQPKLLSSEDEQSLRRYLQTLNLATHPTNSIEIKTEIEQIINSEIRHRLRKKGLTEEAFSQRLGPPRLLDVIDEEGSGESSIQSRRHSYLSDKKSDNDDLEDDVFEKPSQQSNLKKITGMQSNNNVRKKPSAKQIPQKCLLVGTKLKEPEICEARGNWTIQTVEKMTGAEVVYLTDSSSSTSSIHDVDDNIETEEETDASVRMITPIIEVTDTENFLKKTFISNNNRDTTNPMKRSDFTASKESMLSNINKQDGNDAMDQSRHEIEVLPTDNFKTNLIVKDINESEMIHDNLTSVEITKHKSASINTDSELKLVKHDYDFDLEMKVLKCELNDAINNLIKEVSDSESANENSKDSLTRQDSSSSVSSSQCTAIYNPNSSLLNEFSCNNNEESYHNSNDLKDGSRQSTAESHVNDVIEYAIGIPTPIQYDFNNKESQPQKLRDICVERISSLPYGFKILEELANVSLRLQNMNTLASGFTKEISKNTSNSKIRKSDCAQSTSSFEETTKRTKNYNSHIKNVNNIISPPSPPPPPVQPRHSSLKKSKEDHKISEKTTTSYVCLSPSQKMLMEKTNTVIAQENDSPVVDPRKNCVDRKDAIHTECTEIISTKPFKSQTGSRLLALICDPTITSNITSRHLNKFSEKQSDSTSKIQIEPTKSYRKYTNQGSGVASSQDVFKPIPPPRPKKLLSSFYDSDVNTNFAERSLKSMKRERKFFHFSTGNLNKEIEDDISTIQSMHKNYLDVKNRDNEVKSPRRPSLPQDICDQQMEYIRQKEKEVDAEIRRLEEEKFKPLVKKSPRAPMIEKKEINKEKMTKTYHKPYIKDEILWKTHIPEKVIKEKKYSLFSNSQEEILRDKMYSEYRNEIAEREQRKHHKVIKITNSPTANAKSISKSMSALDVLDSSVNNRIEEEFILKARERWNKLGIKDPESEDERYNMRNMYREPKVIEHKIKVIEAGEEKDVYKLPSHLQEFVSFTANDKEQESESSGESECEERPTHVVILCAVMILVLAIGRQIFRLLRND